MRLNFIQICKYSKMLKIISDSNFFNKTIDSQNENKKYSRNYHTIFHRWMFLIVFLNCKYLVSIERISVKLENLAKEQDLEMFRNRNQCFVFVTLISFWLKIEKFALFLFCLFFSFLFFCIRRILCTDTLFSIGFVNENSCVVSNIFFFFQLLFLSYFFQPF